MAPANPRIVAAVICVASSSGPLQGFCLSPFSAGGGAAVLAPGQVATHLNNELKLPFNDEPVTCFLCSILMCHVFVVILWDSFAANIL